MSLLGWLVKGLDSVCIDNNLCANWKIGVVVSYTGDAATGKGIAMHVAAFNPVAISAEGVSAELIAKEKEIAEAKAIESGKPANIVEKMVTGSVEKYLN